MKGERASGPANRASSLPDCASLIRDQRDFFESRATYAVSFRVEQLRALERAIEYSERNLLDALYADLRKPPIEAYVAEIGFVQSDISHAIRHLKRWVRVQRRRTPPGLAGVFCILNHAASP